MIDISNATLTYSVDNLSKCQFEICTPGPGRIYYLQASSKEAMLYWLEALQVGALGEGLVCITSLWRSNEHNMVFVKRNLCTLVFVSSY